MRASSSLYVRSSKCQLIVTTFKRALKIIIQMVWVAPSIILRKNEEVKSMRVFPFKWVEKIWILFLNQSKVLQSCLLTQTYFSAIEYKVHDRKWIRTSITVQFLWSYENIKLWTADCFDRLSFSLCTLSSISLAQVHVVMSFLQYKCLVERK